MEMTKINFKKLLKEKLREMYTLEIKEASNIELFNALGSVLRSFYTTPWMRTNQTYKRHQNKQVYYFSIEFLPGKMLMNNLLNLNLLDVAKESLKEMDIELEDLVNCERDMALGNGGLGRLASCFMDSLATCQFPGHGNGIRYSYGLFKQKIVDGYQIEIPDDWLRGDNIWEIRKESREENVRFGGHVYLSPTPTGKLKPVYENAVTLRAVPYDTAMIGYHNDTINTMRLWTVEIPSSDEWRYDSIQARRQFEDLTSVLYPDDSNEYGRLVRLQQEYFFVSAGLQSIVHYHKKLHVPMEHLDNYISVHINDTHPAMAVAEMMRILMDEEDLSWKTAKKVTTNIMSYTNHTIMQEALETWPVAMVQQVVPRIYQIIEEIDRRYIEDKSRKFPHHVVENTRIIKDDQVHMANLAIIGSHSINGVAKLHSDLLKNVVLKDFYTIYPERFNNKTNGITMRRWLQLSDPELSKTIDEAIGSGWRADSHQLVKLMSHEDDNKLLKKIGTVKQEKKEQLAQYIQENMDITVDTKAIFDVQIKRIHGYKRQLLNLMHIIKLYLDLKENPDKRIYPRVFMFAGKAAPSYTFAKMVIKCINEVARMINNDPDIKDQIKVIFFENYNVSLAEKIIPAANISEQISLASKEASGTSNMKLMLNGALTLATLDGANVEIRDAVGEDNIFIFGMTEKEVYQYYENGDYSSWEFYQNDPVIHKVVNAFIDGTIPNINEEGREIYKSLIDYNDEYFLLRDFECYCAAQERAAETYQDQERWLKKSLINIANAGKFSADDTIKEYANDIWHIKPAPIK